MQEVAGERGGYLHGRGALDSDDLLYLKEQMEAEEDAERLLRRTEKRAFAAFRKAASLADSSPASLPLPLRVEPKPKSGIRQQDLLRKIVEIRPKHQRVSGPSDRAGRNNASPSLCAQVSSAGNTDQSSGKNVSSLRQDEGKTNPDQQSSDKSSLKLEGAEKEAGPQNVVRSLLGLTYESSDED